MNTRTNGRRAAYEQSFAGKCQIQSHFSVEKLFFFITLYSYSKATEKNNQFEINFYKTNAQYINRFPYEKGEENIFPNSFFCTAETGMIM